MFPNQATSRVLGGVYLFKSTTILVTADNVLSSTDTIPEETTDKFITLCIYSVVTTTGLWFHLDLPMALMLY